MSTRKFFDRALFGTTLYFCSSLKFYLVLYQFFGAYFSLALHPKPKVSHHLLLAHARAVHTYRNKYQSQNGKIGITLNINWALPYSSSSEDKAAQERNLLFQGGWYADPVFFGDYPEIMKKLVGERLPTFTQEQKQMLKGSHDFFGLNHYTSNWAKDDPHAPIGQGWGTDQKVQTSHVRDGIPIGPQAASDWLYVYPQGMKEILLWIHNRYNTSVFVTENGVDVPGENEMPLKEALNDTFRVNYFKDYLQNLKEAVAAGVDVQGYFAWSLLDNFEWADGYHFRFGINYVDYEHNLTRYEKDSAKWFTQMIQSERNQ